MNRDLGTLQIEKLIVHEVPKRLLSKPAQEITLSEIESELPQDLNNYFQQRISRSLAAASFAVRFDPDETTLVAERVYDCVNGGAERFVENSQQIARHLYDCQNGNNSGGLLVVAQANIEQLPAIAILKLEKEEAIRLQQTQRLNKATFDLHYLRDLTLNDRTKVFKVGLFVHEGCAQDEILGHVCDKQQGYRPTREVAEFFLKRFLGCKLCEEPDVATKRFYELSQQFINENVKDPAKKAQYHIGLVAELNNSTPDITPREFAKQHFDVEDCQPYIESLAASNFTEASVPKNINLIEPQLKKMYMDLASGISVMGPADVIKEQVKMTDLDDGRTTLEITDRIKKVR